MKTLFVFTGPECCGKSTLSEYTANRLSLPLIPEYARTYLQKNGPSYREADLNEIASVQQHLEINISGEQIICDTDLLTLYIWKKEVFKIDDTGLLNALKLHHRHYLLCTPDIPWIADPLRENPLDRHRLFTLYHDLINELGFNYVVLDATDLDARCQQAASYIKSLI